MEDLVVVDDRIPMISQDKTNILPSVITERIKELNHLVDEYPYKIPTDKVAKFLKMDIECLKRSIEQNKAPFALGCDNQYGNRYSYISSLTFYLWCLAPIL